MPPTVLEVWTNIFESFILFLKIYLAYVQSIYNRIVPVKEKCVKDEIVLITGTGHGIGKELAKQYGNLGAIVVCVDINEKLNLETVDELKKNGAKAYSFRCDVSKREEIFELRDKIVKNIGHVTILVNNAGIFVGKKFLDHTAEDITRTLAINVAGNFWTIQAFLPGMKEVNNGHIVSLCSLSGLAGSANTTAYSASKFAVRGLMESLKEEFRAEGWKINCTTVFPFIVNTGLIEKPRIMSHNILGLWKPGKVAAKIISGQRKNQSCVALPWHIIYTVNVMKTFPDDAYYAILDYLQSGVDV